MASNEWSPHMAGRKSKPLFIRDGVFYARINGNRWSTETNDEQEAMRRRSFMLAKGKPWTELKLNHGDKVIIHIDPEGRTYTELVQHYSEPAKAMNEMTKRLGPQAEPTTANSEPPKTSKDIAALLDYEYSLKKSADAPEGTLLYYRQRYDSLKRYVRERNLDLDSFTKKSAFEYPNYRMTETVRHVGQLGYNNRKPSFATINKEIKHWRNLWRTWKEENRVQENVWMRVPLLKPKGTEDELESPPYTFEEVISIIDNIDEMTVRAVCIFQCMLGARPGEETLGISATAIKTGKIWNAKKRRWDSFHYSEEARKFYSEFLDGKMHDLTADKIRIAFKKACQKANVRIGTPYDLRHWFGTESLLDNKIEIVQLMLRHKEIRTTQVYAKIREKAASQAQDKMQQKVLNAFAEGEKRSAAPTAIVENGSNSKAM